MPSSKTTDYDVEKIVSKRTDRKGQTLYLIKWKGYSSSENTWEPENNVTNCQEMIEAFEAEDTMKNKPSSLRPRPSQRPTRSSSSTSKNSNNQNEKSTRTSNRNSSARQQRKRVSSSDSTSTDDTDEDNNEKKSTSKRLRKSTTDTETTPSIDSYDSDILDMAKLDEILNVRRNKRSGTIEYYIQVKKIKKSVWISSDQLTEDYSQQVVNFLEEKYV